MTPDAPPGGPRPPDLLPPAPAPGPPAAAPARFEAAGVATVVCHDGAEALLQAGARRPRALLLGAPLPVVDCARVTTLVARLHPVPVVVAAGADGAAEATDALAAGAVAYVARPYRTEEIIPLLAFGRAPAPLVVGDIELDPVGFHVHVRGNQLRLPVREFMVLRYLMEHVGRVVPRAELTRALWGTDTLDSNTLTVHVRRVRNKLQEAGGSCTIDAIRGMGYRLEVARVRR
ncbi:response regulator transcription factor [Streptomyces sp. N35]|uniref:winged helix-turn-helix transcriptional regulator n=1 Tax=Streptomyces sp. N35 TaxID=2795730 RepID=UPI0018F41161|nr:response regulator transcription factor [Streptomyces sp. N35]